MAIKLQMAKTLENYVSGSQYWFEEGKGCTLLNNGTATYVSGGVLTMHLTMTSTVGQYLVG